MPKMIESSKDYLDRLCQSIKDGNSYELNDIFERTDYGGLRAKVEENIEFTLRREKLISQSWFVVIPAGADTHSVVDRAFTTPFRYLSGFNIFSGRDTIVACGSVAMMGGYDLQEKEPIELLTMDINITEVFDVCDETQRPLMFFG